MQSTHEQYAEISAELAAKLDAIPDKKAGLVVEFTPEMDAAILRYFQRKPKKALAKALGIGQERLKARYLELTEG